MTVRFDLRGDTIVFMGVDIGTLNPNIQPSLRDKIEQLFCILTEECEDCGRQIIDCDSLDPHH